MQSTTGSAEESPMQTSNVDQNRRRLLGMATTGIAAAGAAGLLPSQLAAAPAGDAIRPFRIEIPQDTLMICAAGWLLPAGRSGKR